MQKSIFFKFTILLIVLIFVLPRFGLAAEIVSRKGKIVQKDTESLVMESYEDISFWKALFQLFQYGKVKYVVFNKSLTEIKKITGGLFSHKEEKISFGDLKVGDDIDVIGELQKTASKDENGEINANSIKITQSSKDIPGVVVAPMSITNTTGAGIAVDNNVSIPWLKSTVVTLPEVYKSLDCADDGEPILKLGLITGKVPTECCAGLKLCPLVSNIDNAINYKGFTAIVIGYCKKECPVVDTSRDLLPNTKIGQGLWGTIKSWFTLKLPKECNLDSDCVKKYCKDINTRLGLIPCDYSCDTEGKCIDKYVINKTKCEKNTDCALSQDGMCVLVSSEIGMYDNGKCVCVDGGCGINPVTTSTTRIKPITTICTMNAECGWCNFNCVTDAEIENFKNMGIICDGKAKLGAKCSCLGNKCQALLDNTLPTIEEPGKPIIPVLPGSTTTTTIKKVTTTTLWKPITVTTLPGDCIQPKCGDGLCHPWEKDSDSILGTCYCLLGTGSFKTKTYANLLGHIVCGVGGLNRNYCPNDCNGVNIPEETTTSTTPWVVQPPVDVEPPIITPPTTIPPTTTTKSTSSGYPVDVLLNGFCGQQTSSSCKIDTDCKVSGCSGEICQAVTDKKYVSTCEWKSCYTKASNIYCGCNGGKCQWYGASSGNSGTLFPVMPPSTTTTSLNVSIPSSPVVSPPGSIISPPGNNCLYLSVMSCVNGVVHTSESTCDGFVENRCYDYIVTDMVNSRCQCR